MKVAFISPWAPADVHAWSGAPFHMAEAMERQGVTIEHIQCKAVNHAFSYKLLRKAIGLTGKYYDIERAPGAARAYAEQADRALARGRFDLVLAPTSIPFAYLRSPLPKVFWADATFQAMVGFYPGNWSRLSPLTLRQGNFLERQAIAASSLAVYASDWAARSAVEDYGADPAKVTTIPFGANFKVAPDVGRISEALASKPRDECRLLFVGVDWRRKGGDLVVDTAAELRRRNINASVDVVGCDPVGAVPDFVRCHGFISKSTPEGRQKLEDLYLRAHYLFVPSLAECYGIVYSEAAAYGVPSLARAVGGVTTAVRLGGNGHALPVDADARQYADIVAATFVDPEAYLAAARSARRDYDERLSWDAGVRTLRGRLEALLAEETPRRAA